MAAALAAAFLTVPLRAAGAQDQCRTRDRVVALLAEEYKEAQVAIGVTNSGGLVEVFAAADGSTWTIVVTSPRGMSCVVTAGEGWHALEWKTEEPET